MALVCVFGASGRQGMAQVRQLSLAGHRVRALSRSPDPFYGVHYANVEIVPADINDDRSLAHAFDGADAVFYTHPFRGPAPGAMRARNDRAFTLDRLGRIAKAQGIKRFVWNTSMWIPDRPGDPGAYAVNTEAINVLWRTGVPATVFGSVLFMDNLLTNWAFTQIVREHKFVYGQKRDLLANWISLDDVAKFMIASLDRPDMEGAWMNIGGPERLTPVAIARILSGVTGHEIVYEEATPRQFGELLTRAFGAAMGEEERAITAGFIDAFYTYNNQAPTRPFQVNTEAMLDRMPIALETFETWARRQEWVETNRGRPVSG